MNETETKDASEAGRQRLRPNLLVLPLDGELVVFSEEAQCLVGLNPSAAFVFRELAKGTSGAKLAQALVAENLAAPAEAGRWVAATLDALGSHGMLADGEARAVVPTEVSEAAQRLARLKASMPPNESFEPQVETRYRLLKTTVLIRYARQRQKLLVDSVIGHLITDELTAPTIVMDIQGTVLENGHLSSDVYCDGEPVGQANRLSRLGPIVKNALWLAAVNAHDFLFYIHAGVVGMDHSCVLLPAAAGSGKSSLTAALTHSGFRYYSDEVALIERSTFQVPPVPLAICVKSTGWEVISRFYPEISGLRIHRRDDGKVVRYISPPAGAMQQAPVPVSHIIFPRHDKDGLTELTPVVRSEAIARLMAECQALRQKLDSDNVRELVRWIAGIDCYALSFSSLEQAVELIARTVSQPIR